MKFLHALINNKHLTLLYVMIVMFMTSIALFASWSNLNTSNNQLTQNAHQYQIKSNLMLTMWDTARARESTFQGMFNTDDPFELDELQMQHMALAGRYIKAYLQLKSMVMSVEEKKQLTDLKNSILIVAPLQDQIRQLIANEEVAKAKSLSVTSNYINTRKHIFEQFEDIFNYYRKLTSGALNNANKVVISDAKIILILTGIVLLLSVVIGIRTLRKISNTEKTLRSEVDIRTTAQAKLEKHQNELQANILEAVDKYRVSQAENNRSLRNVASLGHILESSLNEIYIFDAESLLFIQVNLGARKNLGYTLEELKQLTPMDIQPEIANEKFQSMISPLLNERQDTLTFTTVHQRKDGNQYPVEVHLQITVMNGRKAITALVMDITKRYKNERKIRLKQAENDKIVTELKFQQRALDEHAIVSVADVKGNITYVNDKFCEISLYNKEELIGKNHSLVKSDMHTNEFYRDLWRTIAQGKVWKGEICNKKKDGKLYWLAATIVPFLNEQGKPHKYIAIRFDITKQRINQLKLITKNKEIEAAQEELQKSQHMLLHTEKLASVGQLAAGIAHEINTPIQFVGDNTRFLQEAFDDLISLISVYEELAKSIEPDNSNLKLVEKARKLSDEVELDYLTTEVPNAITQSLDGVDRISTIVSSMKNFSHPGTDHIEHVDLNKNIESTINVSRNEWKYVAEIITNFDTTLTAVPCFPGELNQVILNMIVNAAHAIADNQSEDTPLGTITISTKANNNCTEIRISDSGCGMSQEVREHIFEPFFTTKGVGKGTGQGLAIAYAVVVEKHKGEVNVESEPGKGTTFIISLPLKDIANNDTEQENKEISLTQTGAM